MRKVLLIAYFFPPCAEGGVMRARAFSKYLPDYEWQPHVLTVHDEYYLTFTKDDMLVEELSSRVIIHRTTSFEPKGKIVKNIQATVYGVNRTTNWFERYGKRFLRFLYRALAIPDEHILWLPQAVKRGLAVIREHNIDVLFVTTPPHSAAVIATLLSRLTGKPLIWDVRDDWVDNPLFDAGPWHRHFLVRLLERWIVNHAAKVVSVTRESVESFRQRYPNQPACKFHFIPNGFDQEEIAKVQSKTERPYNTKMRLVYVGTLGATRTPRALFQALYDLKQSSPLEEQMQVDFYGYARYDFMTLSQDMGLNDLVTFHGFVSREESLRQIILSDVALMIIPEKEGSRTAIPGKLYEYIGGNKFVLALCPQNSAPARLINETKAGLIASQHNADEIRQLLSVLIDKYKCGTLNANLDQQILEQFERSRLTRKLVEIFER